MKIQLPLEQLIAAGLTSEAANQLLNNINTLLHDLVTPEQAWQLLSKNVLTNEYSFDIHKLIYTAVFPEWNKFPETAPGWTPTQEIISSANISKFMTETGMKDIKSFHHWTTHQFQDFWRTIIDKLQIVFDRKYDVICDLSQGVESPSWLSNAKLNIVNSCFTAPKTAAAIIYEDANKQLFTLTYDELNQLSNRIANSLQNQGFVAGDAIGIAMPMNHYAIAIYLGIIKMGGVVVSIADSFSPEEIALRLKIANAKAIFTQDFTLWGNKKLPLYEKVSKSTSLSSLESKQINIFVVPCEERVNLQLRACDYTWHDFLVDNKDFTPVSCNPMTPCNILFSSGTTGEPKAIVWNHSTPIKAASDAFFHQNIQTGDILAWPTNLGWMMGPWLIFAALINHGCIALQSGAPKDRAFGEFIQRAKVNMLGVVPTLVATWREIQCMENLDWSTIKVFSSTGECSNPEDMLYLMSLAGYKPVIEYCGGTEIGGAYITSTVIQNNYPSLFTTPAMGLDIAILDDEVKLSDLGEVAMIPPSMGLSTTLLNADHHHTYFENMPAMPDGKMLRRHGDQIKRLPGGLYCVLGRVDDTMKLGGIKISAAEIERILAVLPDIIEVAAIAVPPPDNGPSLLVIYASTIAKLDKQITLTAMQKKINTQLNPLFKIHDVILTNELPKTASNKIMRRVLRKQYLNETS